MKTKLLSLVCFVALSACGKTEPGNPAPAASASTPQAAKTAPLKIKDLYIGMEMQSVPNAMMAILAEQQLADFSFTDPMQTGDGSQCALMYTKPFLHAIDARMHERYGEARAQAKIDEEILTSCVNSDGVLMVKSDAENRVRRIEFNDVKDIFDAAGLSPADFVKKLSSEYHIPEMKPNEARTLWSYTSPDGSSVVVDAKEVLGIPMIRLYVSKAAP